MKFLLSIFLGIYLSSAAFAKLPDIDIHTFDSKKMEVHRDRYYYYNFGNERVNSSQWAYFSLRNSGSTPVNIRGVFIWGIAFNAWTNCPHWLRPGERCLTTVEFRPWNVGYFSGRLRFAFPQDSIYVELSGWGVEW